MGICQTSCSTSIKFTRAITNSCHRGPYPHEVNGQTKTVKRISNALPLNPERSITMYTFPNFSLQPGRLEKPIQKTRIIQPTDTSNMRTRQHQITTAASLDMTAVQQTKPTMFELVSRHVAAHDPDIPQFGRENGRTGTVSSKTSPGGSSVTTGSRPVGTQQPSRQQTDKNA